MLRVTPFQAKCTVRTSAATTSRTWQPTTSKTPLQKVFTRSTQLPRVSGKVAARASSESVDGLDSIKTREDDGVQCLTTEEGILLCNRTKNDNKYVVKRLEDDEIKTHGKGAMVENWFLEGHTANAYCSVSPDGTLVCNLHEEGVYMVKEIHEDGSSAGQYVVECQRDADGNLVCHSMNSVE